MKQKLLLNWVWVWVWVRFRVRGFFSNCDAYQFFHVFHLVIHFFYCLQHRICFQKEYVFWFACLQGSCFFLIDKQLRSTLHYFPNAVSYTHLRAHETDSYLVCRLLL